MLLRQFTFVFVMLLSTITFVPDKKATSEDTTTRMQERAVEMRRMEVETHSMFAMIENPPPKPALTDMLPNLTDIPFSHIWLAIAGFTPSYCLLTPIFYFWYLRNSGGNWMSMLYLLGIELEQGLGHDSCLFKMFAIALLLLQVANILSRRPVVSRRTQRRTAPNPEMNTPSSNTADPPHHIIPSGLSTALCELSAVQDNGPFTATLPEDIVITTIVHLTDTVDVMMEQEDGTFTSIPVEYTVLICVVETTSTRCITISLDSSILGTAL